jgi:hypothetical protein
MTVQIAGSICRLCLAERPPLLMGSKKRRDYGRKKVKTPTKIENSRRLRGFRPLSHSPPIRARIHPSINIPTKKVANIVEQFYQEGVTATEDRFVRSIFG